MGRKKSPIEIYQASINPLCDKLHQQAKAEDWPFGQENSYTFQHLAEEMVLGMKSSQWIAQQRDSGNRSWVQPRLFDME